MLWVTHAIYYWGRRLVDCVGIDWVKLLNSCWVLINILLKWLWTSNLKVDVWVDDCSTNGSRTGKERITLYHVKNLEFLLYLSNTFQRTKENVRKCQSKRSTDLLNVYNIADSSNGQLKYSRICNLLIRETKILPLLLTHKKGMLMTANHDKGWNAINMTLRYKLI